MNQYIKTGKYRHFKGNEYEVIGVAKHSETIEAYVVYKPLYGDGGLWIRPVDMFMETVERDGKRIKRFEYIDDESISDNGSGVNNVSTPDEKIKLFMSLFASRDDVYAKRWENKVGKSGYSPVCLNEWEIGICNKPKVKCSECSHRNLKPIDETVIERHLKGKDVIGIYPMFADETCKFLAIDFDDENWQQDVSVIREVCLEKGIPIAVERSRSGNGAHVWIFFDENISCITARKLGSSILTYAMNKRHELKFKSYDRLFPNQDTMPKGGFGNLIALPLQMNARQNENSLFIDENFMSYDDQWKFLSGIAKLKITEIEGYISELSFGNDLGELRQDTEESEKPWEVSKKRVQLSKADFPISVNIVKANMLYIEKEGFSQTALNQIKRLAAFRNPEFYKAQAMRLPTFDKPRVISISDETDKYLCLPRGLEDEISNLLNEYNVNVKWFDKTNKGKTIDIKFNGELRAEQEDAIMPLLEHNNGILSATTAFGKTVIGAKLIAERKVNTLILVHRTQLLQQWKERLSQFLVINETIADEPKKRGRKKDKSIIGQIGGSKNNPSGVIDIAVMQSLVSGDEVKDIVKNYGMVIVDECHHVSAFSFEQILKTVNAKYVYGLTATPTRQDGHHPIIFMHCGKIRYRVDAKSQAEKRPFEHYIIPRFTGFKKPTFQDEEV